MPIEHSQAAIQASKEGAKEVTLKHFEWAKVSPNPMVPFLMQS
jgi:hypothetical protein